MNEDQLIGPVAAFQGFRFPLACSGFSFWGVGSVSGLEFKVLALGVSASLWLGFQSLLGSKVLLCCKQLGCGDPGDAIGKKSKSRTLNPKPQVESPSQGTCKAKRSQALTTTSSASTSKKLRLIGVCSCWGSQALGCWV